MICPGCEEVWRANYGDTDLTEQQMENFCAHVSLCYGEHPHQLGECITWETAQCISRDGP